MLRTCTHIYNGQMKKQHNKREKKNKQKDILY